jgi:hypothetical protein
MAPDPALLDALFPEGDYRFHLTLRRGDPARFLSPWDASGALVGERRSISRSWPSRHLALTERGRPALDAFNRLVRGLGLPEVADAAALATAYEPDLLFVVPGDSGRFTLEGGALCFPTGWGLDQKLGQPMESLHGAVPGLNAALGPAIGAMLARLRPGQAMERRNWGLTGSDALNRHPEVPFRPLAAEEPLERLWLRIEHQILVGLDEGSVLFGIRIEQPRLDAFCADTRAGRRLGEALASMPEALAAYKGLAALRAPLARRLGAH